MEEHFHKGHAERHQYDPGEIIHYKIKINDVPYEVDTVEIEGKELAKLVNLNLETHAIYAIKHDQKNEVQPNELVDLGGYGIEKFVSEPRHEHEKHDYEILVNRTPERVKKDVVSYDEIVTFAFPDYPQHPERNYSVKYKDGPGEKPEGILSKGATVKIKNKMKFDVTPTGQS